MLEETEYFENDLLEPLLEVVSGNEFREEVSALPGYEVSEMGKVIAELEAS